MININNRRAEKSKIIHVKSLRTKVFKSSHFNKLPLYIQSFIKNNINEILGGKPDELARLNSKFYAIQRSSKKRKYDNILKKVFSYSNFNRNKKEYNLHELSENVAIKYCPYCNRQSTINVRANSIKPDFDHYFPQNKYPLLGLSFYNLIPSCTICNSRMKIGQVFRLKKFIHPYIDNSLNSFRFTYKYDLNSTNGLLVKIRKPNAIPIPKKVTNTLTKFKILEIYNAHTDEVLDLIKIKQLYSDRYLKILASKTYKELHVSHEELYRLAFGVYYNEDDFSKRPFSKLKKDILAELNIIKY